jgi:hypothetical protein
MKDALATLDKIEKLAAVREALHREDEPEVVLPAELKRRSAERMRDLGRSLMISGMRPPRQQMVSIAVTIDGLMQQLDELAAESPALANMRRRIMLGLRSKIVGGG